MLLMKFRPTVDVAVKDVGLIPNGYRKKLEGAVGIQITKTERETQGQISFDVS